MQVQGDVICMWFVYTHNICTNRFTICKIRAMWIYIIIAYKLHLLWTGRVKTWNERKCSSGWLACTNYIKLWQYLIQRKEYRLQRLETRTVMKRRRRSTCTMTIWTAKIYILDPLFFLFQVQKLATTSF